ncbi:PP2C family protein-serine/threonine phosphatase [Kineococcus rhizosphaerae]|uniref:PAS domain S-box-containing protein n=1 Tax=Kineococcus rhizosphaerae TaxID=559628 RepID=A0A2T0R205_9ACTN|nr:SpoIIE family protein phosphatase [Kineococcus rhizosphaerae]PRY13551.1 PAS domain S-box-containing protein [Kineococcus rhizosphaerae]
MTTHSAAGPDAVPADPAAALAEEHLRSLLVRAAQQGRNAVCLSDVSLPDQPVVWVNEAFTAITGYTFDQTVGRNCRFLQDGVPTAGELSGGPDVTDAARRIRELIDDRRSGTVVIPNRRADGGVFYNALALSPLPDERGVVRYYLGVQQDVTEQIRAEQARDRSYAEAAELADQLQNRLVPAMLADTPEWDVAVRYQPATRADGSRGEVSGDFYDLQVRPDGHVLAVIGDVSGRGPRAAATTAALRWSIRGLSSVVDRPGRLLEHVADAVHEALDDRFATVAAVRLPEFPADAEAGRDAVVALAGHPQPVLLPRGGPARFVGRPGMLLGPFADVTVLEEQVPVRSGDVLVLYTDGVTEAASPEHELLGDEGLLGALDEALDEAPGGARTADDVADAVLRAVARHVAGGPTDDLTLMVLRRR